jgi:hypothetical protein
MAQTTSLCWARAKAAQARTPCTGTGYWDTTVLYHHHTQHHSRSGDGRKKIMAAHVGSMTRSFSVSQPAIVVSLPATSRCPCVRPPATYPCHPACHLAPTRSGCFFDSTTTHLFLPPRAQYINTDRSHRLPYTPETLQHDGL